MPEMTGPSSSLPLTSSTWRARGLLINWGDDRSRERPIMNAVVLGYVDYYLAKPVHSPDERFHRGVTEFLDEWWRLRGGWFEMVRVIGADRSARSHEVRDLLTRNDIPYGFYTSDSEEGRDALAGAGAAGRSACRSSSCPTDGPRRSHEPRGRCGARGDRAARERRPTTSPSSAAVPPASPPPCTPRSEGLRTALDRTRRSSAVRPGPSSLIRNYLGFPRGVSGNRARGARVRTSAIYSGPTSSTEVEPHRLRAEGHRRIVGLEDGSEVTSHAVVIATGAAYRRLGVPELEALTGCGVFYGAAVAEAQALAGEHVFVIGGGNSAGQAALHSRSMPHRSTILVRSNSLAESMSAYLITEIDHTPHVDVRHGVEVVGGGGDGHLEWLELRIGSLGGGDCSGGRAVRAHRCSALHCLAARQRRPRPVGLRPDRRAVRHRDLRGAGRLRRRRARRQEDRPALPLETSLAGVLRGGRRPARLRRSASRPQSATAPSASGSRTSTSRCHSEQNVATSQAVPARYTNQSISHSWRAFKQAHSSNTPTDVIALATPARQHFRARADMGNR